MSDQLEARMADQMPDISLRAAVEVIKANHGITFPDKTLAQMRAYETGTAGDQNLLHFLTILSLSRSMEA